MRRRAISLSLLLSFAIAASAIASAQAAGPTIQHRTCSDVIASWQPLCDPGEVNIVASRFDLFAKAVKLKVDPTTVPLFDPNTPAQGQPPAPLAFTAYLFAFDGSATSGWLAPPIFHVPQARHDGHPAPASLGHIKFALHDALPDVLDNTFMINNSIPGGPQPINIHTHGMLVLPHRADAHGAYGDYVGVLGCPANVTPSCPHDPTDVPMTEVCGMAASAAAHHPCGGGGHDHAGHEVLLKPIDYDIEVPGDHPASLNWFHPHAHGISSPQVAAGLSGVLTVGSICSDAALDHQSVASYCVAKNGESVPDESKISVRTLMLKDLEVFDDRQGDAPDHTQKTPSAEGYRIVPTCLGDKILTSAYCQFAADDAVNLPGHWLFTVNGQIKPTVAMTEGKPEIWRIANIGSNATYRLSLCKGDLVLDNKSDPNVATCPKDKLKAFKVISLDGGRKSSDTKNDEDEMLLPPGARAEIQVEPKAGETFSLVQKGFDEPDIYPPVILATVSTLAGTATPPPDFKFGLEPAVQGEHAQMEEPEDCEHPAHDLGPNDWLSLKGHDETVSVFFGKVSADPEILTLGFVKGDVMNSSDQATKDHITNCLNGNDPDTFDCKWFKGKPFSMAHRNLCLKHGATVTFKLYNLTTETHSFHIHQQKFGVGTVAAATGGFTTARISGFTPANAAALRSVRLRSTLSAAAGHDPAHAAIADSLPVLPFWAKDDQGNIIPNVETITMSFDKPEQVGDFVFHCHILEHEDKGMMKRITIWTKDTH